jgi:hypothetical protein
MRERMYIGHVQLTGPALRSDAVAYKQAFVLVCKMHAAAIFVALSLCHPTPTSTTSAPAAIHDTSASETIVAILLGVVMLACVVLSPMCCGKNWDDC